MCESQETPGFAYMDEDSINAELKCSICFDPFTNPVTTSCCNNVFCLSCIEKVLKKKPVCPLCCHEPLSRIHIKLPDLIIFSSLYQLLVKCESCGESNIQRGFFNEHINVSCPKIKVTCSGVDLKCEWVGPRDQLASHITSCNFEYMRPIFGQFISTTKELKFQVNCLRDHCRELEIDNKRCNSKLNALEIRCQQLELMPNLGKGQKRARDDEIPVTKSKLMSATRISSTSSNCIDAITEENVRNLLTGKLMTSKELIQEYLPKNEEERTREVKEAVVQKLAIILKRLNIHEKIINGKKHIALRIM
ncbi:unnamed protein product [Rotaria socialis]|nr:unnamed protein product [Rotaria socialis]CAF3766804.1 unnamed protein product [Rotaria socialis]